jgi:hypothetical protein
MSGEAGLRLNAAALARYALPDIAYPLSFEVLREALEHGGELPLAEMLCALQAQAEKAPDWLALEPALSRLAELLAPEDPRQIVTVEGDDWWLELGPVNLEAEIVTLQRGGHLLAAIAPRADRLLRVAAYRPLDGAAIQCLIALGRVPHPVHGVSMGRDSWEYALDSACGNGQFYASIEGRCYLSWWGYGLGLSEDRSLVPEWRAQLGLEPRAPRLVATELGVYYSLASAGTFVGDDAR